MSDTSPDVLALRDTLLYELTKALALPDRSLVRGIIRGIFGKATEKFSELAIGLDRAVGISGVSGGANWILPRFVKSHIARGIENRTSARPKLPR